MKGDIKCPMEDDERSSRTVRRSIMGMPPCIPNKYSRRLKHLSLGIVAPRLRATGLPYIASPEIMSSGNAQHIGTEYNRFIIIIQVHKFGVTTATRHGGTSRAATLSTFFMSHLKASI